jgi:hypothetical protein
MKKSVVKGLIVFAFVVVVGFTALSLTSVSADALYEEASDSYGSVSALADDAYTFEEMLTYALQDEYMAQAEYQAIIDTYGEIRPFTNIILAEGTHISLLLPLFETYGVVIPENIASENTIVPDSITSALATGIEAEEMNIAMYEAFLAQTDLPDDVRTVFTYLKNASVNHLNAFSKDRYSGLGTDLMNQFKKQFKNTFSSKNTNQTNTCKSNLYQNSQTCPNL